MPQRNTMDLAICATLQPTAAAASAAVRVPAGNWVMVSGWPAVSRAARTRSTEPPVSLADILYAPRNGTSGALYPLAVLPGQVPVLRLQLSCARSHPAGRVPRRAAPRAGVGGGVAWAPAVDLDLLRRRHA